MSPNNPYSSTVKNLVYIGIKINPILLLFLPWFASFPIYYIAADWGRYLYISYLSSLILIIFFIQNNIFKIDQVRLAIKNFISKIIFVSLFIIYAFGCTVPVCCEKNLKFGISDTVKRIIYYYNKNN